MTMSEESSAPYYVPNRAPTPRRPPKPGENALLEFQDGHDRYLCELRHHGDPFGVEAQFYRNGQFLHSQRFDTRELAVLWAKAERRDL